MNDRLLLGMKGTTSEMELASFRQWAREAMKQKARRGELFMPVPIGYVRTMDDLSRRIPTSACAGQSRWCSQSSPSSAAPGACSSGWESKQGMEVPSVASADRSERVVWKAPRYHSLLSLLQNPTHAGVYAYGRSKTLVRIESGRKRVVHTRNRDAKGWAMMLPEHQDGYIGWDAYRGNQELMGSGQNQGVIRLQNYPTILALLQ